MAYILLQIISKSFLFQTILFGLFGVALYLLHIPYWEAILAFCAVQSFGLFSPMKSLAISNLLFWLVTGSLAGMTAPYFLNSYISADDFALQAGYEQWQTKPIFAVSILILLLLYFVLFELFKRFQRLRYPILIFFLTFLALGFTVENLEMPAFFRLVLVGTLFALSKTFWMACYQLSEVDLLKKQPFLHHFGTLNSPWQLGWGTNSITGGFTDYLNIRTDKPMQDLQLSAVKLIYLCVLLQFISKNLHEFAVGRTLHWQNYVSLSLARPYAWSYVLVNTLCFLLTLAAYTNAVVSIARMCGFAVKLNVYKPHLATSFNSFLSRIYYYYIAVLKRFFFFPLLAHSRIVRQRHIRLFAVYFLTIFLGGYLVYFLRFVPHWAATGFFGLQEHLIPRAPYLILLAAFSAVSGVLPKIPGRILTSNLRLALPVLYFVLYSVCFSFNLAPISVGLRERIIAFLYLFGF